MTKTIQKKIGVLLSAGGSAFETAMRLSEIPSNNFYIVTDRECGAERVAERSGIARVRVVDHDRRSLSKQVAERMRESGCDLVLMHFSRLVSEELYDSILTFNVHPSLLPSFAGLDGVGDAVKAGVKYQGATLHLVDKGVDTGPIVAQTCYPVPASADMKWRHHLAYIQKALVTLSLFDLLLSNRIDTSKRGMDSIDTNGLNCSSLVNPAFSDRKINEAAVALLYDFNLYAMQCLEK